MDDHATGDVASDRYVPVRQPAVEWVELDGEIVVYEPHRETLHRLNGSAARVWAACDGSTSVVDIVRELTEAFPGSAGAIASDVPRVVRRFHDVGLIRSSVPT